MDIHRRALLGAILTFAAAAAVKGQQVRPYPPSGDPAVPWPSKERFPLWPGSPPGAPKTAIVPRWTIQDFSGGRREVVVQGVAMPEVHVFRPAHPDGSALLAMPGGGYSSLWVRNEGLDVARFFNTLGTTVFVLTYRLPGEGWSNRGIVPLADAQRAMRLIRSRAADFRIDPKRLGALGFSAAGHLAADLGVSFNERVYQPVDPADALSAKPAYLGLVYPVTTLVGGRADGKAWEALTGPGSTPSQLEARSPLLHINKDTPPTFLVHAADDGLVRPRHSFRWAEALIAQGIPVETHVLAQGGHGFGLHLPPDNPGSRWPELFNLWLRKHGG